MTLLSQLAVKTQCEVLSGVAIREPNGKGYRIEFSKVTEDINNKDINVSLNALNGCIERIAKANPVQYQWEYKRFKKTPEGSEVLY